MPRGDPSEPPGPPAGPRLMLLLVDDERVVRETLAPALEERLPVRCVTAEDALQARRLLAAHRFDAVLADYLMPGEDGIALLCMVKEAHPNVARVLITGHARSEVRERARAEAAVHAFVRKPYNLRLVQRTMAAVLRGRKPPRDRSGGRGWTSRGAGPTPPRRG